jgi:glutamate--cysteine ligase
MTWGYCGMQVPHQGLATPFRGGTLLDVARLAVGWAREGLVGRGRGEEAYLAPLERIVAAGRTLADQMLDSFHGSWGESVAPEYGAESDVVC